MQLSIIIVNWNAGQYLVDSVSSIGLFCPNLVCEVFVIDNASTDNSINLLNGAINLNCKISVVCNTENLGFAAACNLGARHASGEFLLFLNPDAALFLNTLPAVLKFMNQASSSDVGICGVQLVDNTGNVSRSCTRFPTALGLTWHAVGMDRLFPRLGHFMSEWDHSQTREVDHVIGAFLFIRHSLFLKLNGFDERFFVYLEDLDLSLRSHQLGWRSIYLTDAQAFHVGGGTSRRVKAHRLFYSLRSRQIYAFKHFSRFAASVVLFSTLFIEPFSRICFATLCGSWSGVTETLSAYCMLWRWLPRWLLKGVTR
jgi:GT2 family glycosyltransferase